MDVFTLDVERDWLDAYPKEEFDRQDKKRAAKTARAAKVFKVRHGYDADSKIERVNDAYKWKERLIPRSVATWAGLVRGILTPPRTQWLEITSNNPAKSQTAAVLSEAVWNKLMTNGNDFTSMFERILTESACTFGVAVYVCADYKKNPYTGQNEIFPKFKVFDFDDFVLDGAASTTDESFIIFRYKITKAQLVERSQPVMGSDGQEIHGPIYDPNAVSRVLDKKSADEDAGNEYGNARKSARSKDDEEDGTFCIYEFFGTPKHEDKLMPENQHIVSCDGICLRATDSYHPFKTWVLFGSRPGAAGDIYPESLGEELANIELKINYGKTISNHARSLKSAGISTFDTEKADELKKWSRHLSLSPGSLIPNIIQPYNYQADLSDVETERMQLLEIAGELVGVSKQAMSGLPAPGISATGTIASQQAVQARIGNDANHYTPQLISLLKAAMDVIVQSWEAEEVIYMPDGTAIPVNRDELQGFHGGILVNSVGASSVAVYQQQQIMQMHALLSQSPFYNQLEGVKLVVDSFQLPEIRTRNLLQMPPPMPMPGQPTGPQGIAGQPPRKQGPGQPKPEMPPMGGEAPPKIPGQASRRLAERGQNPFTVRGTSPEGPPR